MQRIGEILPSLCIGLGIEDAIKLKFLRKKWSEIFNPPLTEYSFPKDLKDGVLFVNVNCHLWLSQLKLLKEEFLKKLHPYGVKDVEFRFGRVYKTHTKNKKEDSQKELSPEQQHWILEILKKIKDNEMKTVTESLMKKYLIFTETVEKR
ncbi:MAG: DUF721 domain-containing protein [Thermodesulfovibrio sp.]|nr:DUF721 domain-containing protein [Thermodesulfovibrio sp.]MCX7724615.1 DUF721 domain-containing protein [Thermodesulfovibrio sp.]MDW7972924.1 DUF721 domain-containing protein [Thermodesulfovibrio sp.]